MLFILEMHCKLKKKKMEKNYLMLLSEVLFSSTLTRQSIQVQLHAVHFLIKKDNPILKNLLYK